ncbi:hypothetical protein [Streptomyces violascens]|uniref:Uncharacterized protein n=1 Tax=Streptomyces violascens TaxID=67381 RepID=A0ABQ3QRV1_9ACTN|nr:hypothetical protein [Streptomyces violascens]GGT84741.1 hypothetical protein GCM10010289_00320 [Streptomyces violascens]GHI40010.1 hypothetical protein Sviol_44180 [Streptomyces violascens]
MHSPSIHFLKPVDRVRIEDSPAEWEFCAVGAAPGDGPEGSRYLLSVAG